MPTCLPALPALVAARALEADASAAARNALAQVRRTLDGYDLLRDLLDDMPASTREAGTAAFARRLRAVDAMAQACRERLEEAQEFCASLRGVDSPLSLVEVPPALWEMMSPYLDDAMEPVLDRISRRAGCPVEDVGRIFDRLGQAVPA
jgi:uncharacterized Fe-S cluster-containing protein